MSARFSAGDADAIRREEIKRLQRTQPKSDKKIQLQAKEPTQEPPQGPTQILKTNINKPGQLVISSHKTIIINPTLQQQQNAEKLRMVLATTVQTAQGPVQTTPNNEIKTAIAKLPQVETDIIGTTVRKTTEF